MLFLLYFLGFGLSNEYVNGVQNEIDRIKQGFGEISDEIQQISIKIKEIQELSEKIKKNLHNHNEKAYEYQEILKSVDSDIKKSEMWVSEFEKHIIRIPIPNITLFSLVSGKKTIRSGLFSILMKNLFRKWSPSPIPRNAQGRHMISGNKAKAYYHVPQIERMEYIEFGEIPDLECYPTQFSLYLKKNRRIFGELLNQSLKTGTKEPQTFYLPYPTMFSDLVVEFISNKGTVCIPEFSVFNTPYISL